MVRGSVLLAAAVWPLWGTRGSSNKQSKRREGEGQSSKSEVEARPRVPGIPDDRRHHGLLAKLYWRYDEEPVFDHWLEYATYYERHLPPACSGRRVCEPVRLLEIGVQSGGSTRIWHQYYGDHLRYVGVDINPLCKRSEVKKEHITIEIGSQLDAAFLSEVCAKHGPFDVVIDDGGHTFEMINATLRTLWPSEACMRPSSVYAIEDLHTMVMCEASVAGQRYCRSPAEFSSLISELFYSMLYYWDATPGLEDHQRRDRPPHPVWGNRVTGIHLYDSLVFIHRGSTRPLTRIMRGTDRIPYTPDESPT
mmetsp:Transcript_12737/g.40402  ORF Transcript_12737/g.40402 Transcript_12737/m.40402 type:complete len:307 (+) Transcript_12737:59-979(+)